MKLKLILYSLLIFFAAIGCSAPTLFYLHPTDDEFNYYQGREVVSREDSVATTLLNFEYQEENDFSFYAEITNNSSKEFLIDPALFYVEILKPSTKEHLKRVSVIDPESKIELIQEDINNTEDSKEAAVGMNILLGVFNAAVDIASDAPAGKVVDDIAYWGSNAHNEAVEHDIKSENLLNLKRYWENNVLRKTTLSPGENFGGIFYLPIQYKAKYLKLILPINNVKHEFIFQQEIVN